MNIPRRHQLRLDRARQRRNMIALGFGWAPLHGRPMNHWHIGKADGTTAHVYFAERDGLIKIGISQNPELRAHVQKARLLACIPHVGRFELFLHWYFEGFRVSPKAEWFEPAPPLLDLIDRVNRVFPLGEQVAA